MISFLDYLKKILRPFAIWALVLICLASFALMYSASQKESAIMDELAHIPAGYGYVRNFDYRLNPEHPPLVKALAMLPVLFLDPIFPITSTAWTTDVNGQWAMGADFLYNSGNDADKIIRTARIMPMLLTILLIVLIYIWAREILGRWWGLIPAFVFGLSPTVLAHGHYVTTDVCAAFGIILATYFFLKFLNRPSRRHLIYAGLAFGVAELAKFSTALLIPYFILLLLTLWLSKIARQWRGTAVGQRWKLLGFHAWKYIKWAFGIFVIGYVVVVYPIYALFTLNYPVSKQTSDTQFILTSFAGGPTPPGHLCKPARCLADLDIWMTRHQITRPLAEYALGVLATLQRSAGGNTGYFLSQVSAAGSRIYFPAVYLLKEPIPVLIMVFLALSYGIWGLIKKIKNDRGRLREDFLNYLELNFTEFSILLFIIIYWIWSILSPLNIGFRHLLPTLPLIYILTADVWRKWAKKVPDLTSIASRTKVVWLWCKSLFASVLKYAIIIILLLWFLAETTLAAPYFLSYFNEFGGGTWNGYRYATDSNYDWGQDLLRLKQWVDTHPAVNKIAVDYFGGGNPKYYLDDREENWWSARGNPADQGIHWLAVSINTLQGSTEPLAPGQKRNPQDSYSWLTILRPPATGLGNVPKPDTRAGTSIFIYKL